MPPHRLIEGSEYMKTLNTIQKLARLGKILSKIAFVFSVIGAVGSVVGIISMALGAWKLQLGGISLHSILQTEAGVTVGTVYASMAVALILCTGEAVLAWFAKHYFEHELADGTPFCFQGAKELMRLGILTVCIPIGTQSIAGIVHSVLEHTLEGVAPFEPGSSGSFVLGIMFLVMSLLCRYGAELREYTQTV